jgi:fatty-acyl-CoA synthase
VLEAVVYGVSVNGADGRAGMAAIAIGDGFDLGALWQHLTGKLPDYARPLFLRLADRIEITTTFRPKKQDLAREGFDPEAAADPIYFNDRISQAFVRLDAALYQRILRHEFHL